MAALLPARASDFTSTGYWRTFYDSLKRTGAAADATGSHFEWYGSYSNIKGNVARTLGSVTGRRAIMLGCGNSKLSEELASSAGLYDITNVDFDGKVIADMSALDDARVRKLKGAASRRARMKWVTGDVTDMKALFPDASFDIAIDKGTLDALTPTAAEASIATASGTASGVVLPPAARMFSELSRLLAPGGVYILISLLQSHVVAMLLHALPVALGQCHVAIALHDVPDFTSPFCAFYVTVTRAAEGRVSVTQPTALGTHATGTGTVTATGSDVRSFDLDRVADVLECIAGLKLWYSIQRRLVVQERGACTPLAVYMSGSSYMITPAASGSESAAPRYSVTVQDVSLSPRAAVVLIPQGREHEWLFATEEGRVQVCAAAPEYGRVIFVALNRGHVFSSQSEVQAQLSCVIPHLLPPGVMGTRVPYMAVAPSIGARTRVAGGTSPISGEYVVEDVHVDGAEHASLRRLVFMSSPHAIQSEAPLPLQGRITFPYHRAMTAALACCCPASPPRTDADRVHVLILGLGSGSLSTFLARACPWTAITSVELDPEMVHVAREHFAAPIHATAPLEESASLPPPPPGTFNVVIGDGLAAVERRAAPIGALIVDVDAKDASLGLSFPPRAFVSKSAFAAMHAAVRGASCGLMMMNVAARAKAIKAGILAAAQKEFSAPCVAALDMSEDVNTVLVCMHAEDAVAAMRWEGRELAAAGELLMGMADAALREDVRSCWEEFGGRLRRD